MTDRSATGTIRFGQTAGWPLAVALILSFTSGCRCEANRASTGPELKPTPSAPAAALPTPFSKIEVPARDFYVKEDFEEQAASEIRHSNLEQELEQLEREIKAP